MASYVTIHLRNAAPGTEQQARVHFVRVQSDAAAYLRGIRRVVESYECKPSH
jgi:hypothetical protein